MGRLPPGRLANELSAAIRTFRCARRQFAAAALCTAAINVLALSAPLYMLEVYNAVLPSRSVAKLALLTLALFALCALSGAIDFMRQRFLARAARRVDDRLTGSIFAAVQSPALSERLRGDGLEPLRDLDRVRAFLCGQGPAALFDLPWIPLYLAAAFLLHPLLGLFALSAIALLLALMLAAETTSASRASHVARSSARRWALAAAAARGAQLAHAFGHRGRLERRWQALNARYQRCQSAAEVHATAIAAALRAGRPAMQSGMLGLGAYLVIVEQASVGSMIAASIILSRGLAPVEATIAHWRSGCAARHSLARLEECLAAEVASRPLDSAATVAIAASAESISENAYDVRRSGLISADGRRSRGIPRPTPV